MLCLPDSAVGVNHHAVVAQVIAHIEAVGKAGAVEEMSGALKIRFEDGVGSKD